MNQVTINEAVKEELLKIVKEATLSESDICELLTKRIIDLNIDSLALMQINFEFESQHALRIDINDIDASTTINQMINKLISIAD